MNLNFLTVKKPDKNKILKISERAQSFDFF